MGTLCKSEVAILHPYQPGYKPDRHRGRRRSVSPGGSALVGYIEAAPTRYIYPVKLKKSQLERVYQEANAKAGEETQMVGGKELKCKTVAGTVKGQDGEQFEYKLWLSDDVPGTIVKQVRTDRQKGEVVAVTTTTLQSYKKAD